MAVSVVEFDERLMGLESRKCSMRSPGMSERRNVVIRKHEDDPPDQLPRIDFG